MFSDTESSYSLRYGMPRSGDGKAPRWEGVSQVSIHLAIWPLHGANKVVPETGVDLQVDEDAFLRMREEFLQMKRKEQQDHQKMRECALAILPPLLCSTQYCIHCIASHIPSRHVLSTHTYNRKACTSQHAAAGLTAERLAYAGWLRSSLGRKRRPSG